MATYLELQTTIKEDFLNRSDLGDATKRAIQRAIVNYQRKRHWFNEAEAVSATTAGSAYFGVPSDFFALDRLELWNGQFRNQLVEASLDYVRTMNQQSVTGEPTHFHNRGNRWELAVAPDSAYSVTVFYLKTLPALSADADSNVWTTELFNLIAHHATYDMLSNVIQQADDRKLSHHLVMLKAAQGELADHDIQRLGSGRLRPTN